MLRNDVELIRRALSGDEAAFATLVRRHQKSVHALIWRKIGDFHHAEEITQDTFIQAYRKLRTLKDPKCFAGWLYVIANRLSINWIQRAKPKIKTQSLEGTPIVEIEESSYTHYVSNQHEAEVAEQHSDIVKKLLEKLPESERTVVTLHYLGEMTAKEIGNFLGVSVNTIKSRLRRGRERLQSDESLVSKVLGGVQLSADFTERVMREVADINPVAPAAGKPMVPWIALGTASVVVILMLGIGNQYLARFQRPYSFQARSEPTIEIVEAPIVIDILSKPALRKQFGQSASPSKKVSDGTRISEATSRSNAQADQRIFSPTHWMRSNSPPGGHVNDIFAVSGGSIFATSSTGIYRLVPDATAWRRISLGIAIDKSMIPIVENKGMLYLVSPDEIFASADNGQTWDVFCRRPKGDAVGFIIVDRPRIHRSQADAIMYLALRDEGVFRSTDAGTHWRHLSQGLTCERISAIGAVKNRLFAATNRGLYCLESEAWRRLPVGGSSPIHSLAVAEKCLYVGTGPDMFGVTPEDIGRSAEPSEPDAAQVFRSRDFGASWTEITPKSTSQWSKLRAGVKVLVAGETLLVLSATKFRSTDGGETWTDLGLNVDSLTHYNLPAVAVDGKTFYKAGAFGVRRTTDAGESWHLFMDGMLGTRAINLVSLNNRLYTHNGTEVFESVNGGRFWKRVRLDAQERRPNRRQTDPAWISLGSKLIVSGNMLYLFSPIETDLQILRLSTDGSMLIPVEGVPAFDDTELSAELSTDTQKTKQTDLSEITLDPLEAEVKTKTLAVSQDVFYVEYKRRLFKWRLGEPKWTNTGLVDPGEGYNSGFHTGFKIAVSGDSVYVGKREGKLLQSLESGSSWRDITPKLPLRFTYFKEIIFSGSTLYVATDNGVLVSETGEHWRVMTDTADTPIVINQFALDTTEVYGIADTGVYRLNTRGEWEQFSAEVPDGVDSLAITNGRLYSAVTGRGIFNLSLAAEQSTQ